MRSGVALFVLCACGSSETTDAGMDASIEDVSSMDSAAIDAPADVLADAPADTGTPPLACMGEVDEPNETEVLASPRPQIDDCDSSAASFSGISSGTGDTDWVRFRGKDANFCTVDPTVKIDAAGLRLCAFVMCTDGVTTIKSCDNGVPATSPAKTKGCCTTGTTAMTPQISCSGFSYDADVFIRVDQPTTNQCIPYKVDYHY